MNLQPQPAKAARLSPALVGIVVVLCGLCIAMVPSQATSAPAVQDAETAVETELSTARVVVREASLQSVSSPQATDEQDAACVDITEDVDGVTSYAPIPCVGQP